MGRYALNWLHPGPSSRYLSKPGHCQHCKDREHGLGGIKRRAENSQQSEGSDNGAGSQRECSTCPGTCTVYQHLPTPTWPSTHLFFSLKSPLEPPVSAHRLSKIVPQPWIRSSMPIPPGRLLMFSRHVFCLRKLRARLASPADTGCTLEPARTRTRSLNG